MEPRIERTGRDDRLECETVLPRPIAEVFPFFADCRNLGRITPDDLSFSILTSEPIVMHEGLQIDYRIRLGGLPFLWRSEITVWDPPHAFVDEQRRGPYRKWTHEHRFLDEGDRTRMLDRVEFRAPGGRLVHELFVNRQVDRIFRHRSAVLARLFPPLDVVASGAGGTP